MILFISIKNFTLFTFISDDESVNVGNSEETHELVSVLKIEQPVFGMHTDSLEEFNQLFADQQDAEEDVVVVNKDGDVIMTIPKNTFPIPIQVTYEDVVKRQNDWLSGNMPFNDSVSILTK